ncbi:MAG TPA: RNA polymerase sigma factor [Candidatus Acidoferrum sp.]|jgi:RNA polymerase sigma-70 factor (ECF subfamily)|nr:RNA polymerase sigma factor [Candidatus Acidoferrum sp.]
MAPCEPVDERVTANSDADALSDLDLIAAINDGDAAAFEVLYFRYRDWVVALAFRFTGDNDAALDVLQETFLYVLRKFPGFRLTANFRTFLYPAVHNLSIAARRKAARYQASEEDLRQLENTAASLGGEPACGDLDLVLARLSEEHREVILLRFVDGLSLGEIAGAMEIPLGTVKSRLHKALQTLRCDERTRDYFKQ